jgi:hypothetical protein
MLVSIFFFTQWTCPNPVMLCAIENDDLGFSVWGPCKNHRDRSYLMPFIAQSMASMAQTFIKNILSHSSVAPLVEANNLLSLMRYTALKMRYIINHHPALVLGDNQSDYYIRMHIYIWEVMWAINQDGYVFLSQNLELPQDWLTRLRRKTHMAGFYVGSIYHPNGLVDANETIIKEVGEEVIRYKHNGTELGLVKDRG